MSTAFHPPTDTWLSYCHDLQSTLTLLHITSAAANENSKIGTKCTSKQSSVKQAVLCEWTSYDWNGIIVVFDGSSQYSVHRTTGVNFSHTYRINTRLSFRSSLSMLSLLRAMTNFRRFTNDTIMTIIHNSATQTYTAVTSTWHCATHLPCLQATHA